MSEKKHGGSGRNQGRKFSYGEKSKLFSMRVPESLHPECRKVIDKFILEKIKIEKENQE